MSVNPTHTSEHGHFARMTRKQIETIRMFHLSTGMNSMCSDPHIPRPLLARKRSARVSPFCFANMFCCGKPCALVL